MSAIAVEADDFMDLAGQIATRDARLSGLQAGILAASALGIAHDSRSFSRLLGVEHALVLRELTALEALGLIRITRRDMRTLRRYFEQTEATTDILPA
ncbi:hypothetical protein [Rhizobium paknamense]|uniref:Formate dehydrogenase n=1 Tax=Rhizobium paknamense TaxID=1206817 RepID=A0ABU0IFS4_9HYPH|nr:hypothetical protein [Rhizobium paknamense]MDQ0457094.1 hypothetical protein [Rhizobium paknamense]